ncbi:hypothetical protein C6Q04_07775 [Burkholderia multivorans]|uniref:hypothetical protein n=1 Tax=Burkholderia multivorans TaxID=87883 RepID=UPI000CFF81A7|nr:hypothetical protein [Burkholderia multivorans]PRF49347.1 hypothetical protein C6Q04_07775 [Burkholderia multivorans]
MKPSAVLANITRKIHNVAVQAHIASLRLSVAAAKAEHRAVSNACAATSAAITKLVQKRGELYVTAGKLYERALNVETAAKVEAARIGGTL